MTGEQKKRLKVKLKAAAISAAVITGLSFLLGMAFPPLAKLFIAMTSPSAIVAGICIGHWDPKLD